MRETVLKLINATWRFIKHPVTLTLLGGSAGSVVTHMLGNTRREIEIKKLKDELDESRNNVKDLNKNNEKFKSMNHKFVLENQTVILRLIESKQNETNIKFNLNNCATNKNLLKYAFDNSYCFYRNKTATESNDKKIVTEELQIK